MAAVTAVLATSVAMMLMR